MTKHKRLVFDIETNGFYENVSRLHCNVIMDKDTGELLKFVPSRDVSAAAEALTILSSATHIIGHNIIGYDLPVLKKLYPSFAIKRERVTDTMILSRLLYPNLNDLDWEAKAWKRPPARHIGSHSLEAWGYRLGYNKLEYDGGWETFSNELLEYNVVDVEVTNRLYDFLLEKRIDPRAVELEHQVAFICTEQEIRGFTFDVGKAEKLAAELQTELHRLETELQDTFKPWVIPDGPVRRASYASEEKGWWGYYGEPYVVQMCDREGNPKLDRHGNPKMRTKKDWFGYRHQPIKFVIFNPGSRHHIADRLMKLFNWKPKAFTPNGQPQIDEDILGALPWPEAKLLAKYFMVQKRLALLLGKDQDKGWLNVVRNGKVHGSIITNGAVTGRGTHKIIANIPRVTTPYGKELRALFTASKGKKQVGVDMSGIELRIFAHYLAKWDNGAYGKIVCEGDVHTENQKAAGLPTRDNAKTFIYAFLYGAGSTKLGSISEPKANENKQRKVGNKLKEDFTKRVHGLQELTEAVQKAAQRGYLIGLDGRKLHVRKAHAALNTLLQSAGALLSKRWMVEVDQELHKRGWQDRVRQLIWYHDEIQFECDPELADELGKMVVECIKRAGDYFNIRVPLAGEYKIGNNWAECH